MANCSFLIISFGFRLASKFPF